MLVTEAPKLIPYDTYMILAGHSYEISPQRPGSIPINFLDKWEGNNATENSEDQNNSPHLLENGIEGIAAFFETHPKRPLAGVYPEEMQIALATYILGNRTRASEILNVSNEIVKQVLSQIQGYAEIPSDRAVISLLYRWGIITSQEIEDIKNIREIYLTRGVLISLAHLRILKREKLIES
jgi:hypothetical protein